MWKACTWGGCEGESIGIQKGCMDDCMEGKAEVVLTMNSADFDFSAISRATGLSIDQIINILNSDDKNWVWKS